MNKNLIEVPLAPITAPYLLAIGISCYVDGSGRRYFDPLWVKDLKEHLRYIKRLTLASPVTYGKPPAGYIDLSSIPELSSITHIDLPGKVGFVDTLKRLPQTIRIFWGAVRSNEIIHTEIGSWPLPNGWILAPMAKLSRKFLLIIVESSFWRVPPGMAASFKARLRARVTEFLGRWCLKRADLAIFTQEEYKDSLLPEGRHTGYVDPASWIDEDKVLAQHQAASMWDDKRVSETSRFRIIFAGRLTSQKGVNTLLSAIHLLETKKIQVDVDILGEGELLDDCRTVATQKHAFVKLHLLGVIPYDDDFYKLLRTYHLLVVPTLSDEQPRIIFDAFSQALPVLASNTHGNKGCVRPMSNGLLFEPGNALAFCESVEWAMQNLGALKTMGLTAAEEASRMTHTAMHGRRWAMLSKLTQ